MRRAAVWTAMALATLARTARAERTAGEGEPNADIQSELARQGAALAALQHDLAEERAARPALAVRVSGFVQIDWTAYQQASQDEVDFSSGQPLNQERFTLRRGHVHLDASHGLLSAALEIDANTVNGPQVRPIQAELAIRWPERPAEGTPELSAALGLMKIPFGFEVPELDQDRPFLERANVLRALFPGEFDLGARFRLRYQSLEWAVAVMNGNPIGDQVFPALAPSRTKEVVGRLGVHATLADGVTFEGGLSADVGIGFHEGTPTTKSQLIWRDENGDGLVQPTEIQVIPGSSATPSQDFRRFAVGADARLGIRVPALGVLTVRAEVVRGQNLDRGLEYADPVGAGHDLREVGFYLGATQELTPWALVGVRYDQYNPDADASEVQALHLVPTDRTYRTLALLAMLRYDSARLSIEYDHNGNPLGVGANGAPTTLQDDALTVRGQVRF